MENPEHIVIDFENYVAAHGVPRDIARVLRQGYVHYRSLISLQTTPEDPFYLCYLSWTSCAVAMLLSLRRTDLFDAFPYDAGHYDLDGNRIWAELFRRHPENPVFRPMPRSFSGPFQTVIYKRDRETGLWVRTTKEDPNAVWQDLDPSLKLACVVSDPCSLSRR